MYREPNASYTLRVASYNVYTLPINFSILYYIGSFKYPGAVRYRSTVQFSKFGYTIIRA